MEPLEKLGFHLVGYGCTTCIGNSGPLDEPIADGDQGRRPRRGAACSRATATSRAASTRSCARTTSRRRRSSSPTRSRARWTSTSTTSRSARAATASRSSCATSGRRQKEVADSDAHASRSASMFTAALRARARGRRELARREGAGRRHLRVGRRLDVHPQAAVLRRARLRSARKPLQRHRGRARARDARRLGHDRSHLARRQHRERLARGAVPRRARRRARATSTSTARAAATTRSWCAARSPTSACRTCSLPARGRRHAPPAGRRSTMSIYDASMRYAAGRRPADRDRRQGVRHRLLARLGGEGHAPARRRAVIAESFERIHRSNLIGMGVLPLQFNEGESRESLGLTGEEVFAIDGIARASRPRSGSRSRPATRRSTSSRASIRRRRSSTSCNGGILQYVLKQMAG